MISVIDLSLSFQGQKLFDDVNLTFTPGNCYGVIGANGAGKSTFLKILEGRLEPDTGSVAIKPNTRMSFLEQDHFKFEDEKVIDVVIMGNARLMEIIREKEAIYAKEDFSDEDGILASELEAEFADMDGWSAEANASALLQGLGIGTELHEKKMSELSGKEKVKVLLAKALFGNPEILILDGLPIIAFGSSETPQIIDTAVVANIPNKIAPGTFFTINKIVNKMPKIVINEVALVIVPKSRGIPFPCLTSPA